MRKQGDLVVSKVKIEFELDLHEDKELLSILSNPHAWQSVVWDLNNEFRAIIKHDDSISEETYDRIDKLHQKLHDLIAEYGVSL